MRFSFSATERELEAAVRSFLGAGFPAAALRAVWDDPSGADESLGSGLRHAVGVFDDLAAMGAFDVLVPEEEGGLGLDWSSLVLVLEATGYAALPLPVVETAAVLAPLRRPSGMTSASLGGSPAVWGGEAESLVVEVDDDLLLVPASAV